MNRYYDLPITIILTLAAMICIYMELPVLRLLFALLLFFILPGFTSLAAWFPKRLSSTPDTGLFTLMLSLGLAAVGGLVLHITDIGLQTASWVLWFGLITIFNSGIAFLRRDEKALRSTGFAFRPHQMVLIAAALTISVFALYVARQGALQPSDPGFTQVWMMPSEQADEIIIGVKNLEDQETTYNLVVTGEELRYEDSFTLEANEIWERALQLESTTPQEISALLYRTDHSDEVYRSASLWVDSR